ncbi:ABC transporter ATP-binding protein [Aquirufa sp. OSTEICH-129V]|uniref:ABC transporter ATP-binding protein n=1 Tax=Aquirufa avitistagni TaxID=3104728 RepID=A0ABW6DK38_9BACT
MLELFKRLLKHISPRRRWQFGILAILIVIASISEVIGLGAILPFLTVLLSPNVVYQHPKAAYLLELLEIKSSNDLLIPITLLFSSAILFSGFMRLLLLWAQTKICFALGGDFSYKTYKNVLYQPYKIQISRNSSEVISGLVKASGLVNSIVLPIVNIISATCMLLMILITLLYIDVKIALTSILGFGLIYFIIIRITKRKLQLDSQRISRESTNIIKALNEGLGGIRDILIDNTQQTYCDIYRNADLPSRKAQSNIAIISASPRFILEALGMVLIAFLALFLVLKSNSILNVFPTLGALAMGAQRMLPILQTLYVNIITIKGSQASLSDALELMDYKIPYYSNIESGLNFKYENSLKFQNVNFSYNSDGPIILKDINLLINKGERVGFIGETGSGKSTLIDILMGLTFPDNGEFLIDDVKLTLENQKYWQKQIAHVPQNIFLTDSTILENIAFGVPRNEIILEKVVEAARKAQLHDTIDSWELKFDTLVGERGVRLSGGQKQRIGIARALYKDANVIIFDEATSALDSATETEVMNSINSLSPDLTILIIAHRISTLQLCNKIIELNSGRIINVGKYNQIIGLKK